MDTAATAVSKIPIAEKAAETAARKALEKLGAAEAHTVLFFATSDHHRAYGAIVNKIRQVTGAQNVVGASASGVLTEEMEIQHQSGLALMAFKEHPSFEAFPFLINHLQENNARAGENLGEFLRRNSVQAESLLLLPDAFSFQSSAFFDGFEAAYGYLPMLGGAASENGRAGKSWQICGGEVAYDAVAGLAFSGKFASETGITRSCQPFGEPLRITRADGNYIYEMDGRPAYDILLECLSGLDLEDQEHLLEKVFLGVPMRSYQTDFAGNYLTRNIMSVNAKKGALSCVGPVEEGEFVTFTVRDPQLAERDMRNMLENMLPTSPAPGKPSFGFYFNCCARGEVLYGQPGRDTALIREYFPNVPVIGFFGYGELAPADHVNHLHHHTGVLNLISV